MLLIRRRVQIILLKVNNSDKYFLRCIYMAVGIVRMKLLYDVFVFMYSTLSPVKA